MSVKELDLLTIPQDDFVNTFEVALSLCDSASLSHKTYWDLIDVCEDHIRGKKPKDPKKLKASGLHWANNWNYLKARTKITRVVLENINMVKSAMDLLSIEFKRDKEKGLEFLDNDDDRNLVSMKLGRVLVESMEKESNFNNWLNGIEYPATAFGYSSVIFDENDWMGLPVHPRNIAFEDNTEPNKIGVFVVFKMVKASMLWTKWVAAKNKETREIIDGEDEPTSISTTGWSKDGLEAVLWNALSDSMKHSSTNTGGFKAWEDVIVSINDRSKTIQSLMLNTNNVNIAKIYYKELSRKWTETYIPYTNDWQGKAKADSITGDKILFKRHHGKKNQERIIDLIKDSSFTEGGTIQDFRGLAKYSVEDSMRFNRKKNNIEDKLIFSGSPWIEQTNTQQKEAFKITPSQGFTIMKRGIQLAPNQPQFDLSNHIQSIQMDEAHFLRETEHFDSRIQDKLTSRPVKDEVIQKTKEIQNTKTSKQGSKFSDYGILMMNVIKNLAEVRPPKEHEDGYSGYNYFYDEAEKELSSFIQDRDAKKIIKGLIKQIRSITVEPVMSDSEAIQLAISLSETSFARNRFKRMLLMAQGFSRKEIDIVAPTESDSFRNLRDEWKARVENDMFWNSNDALVTGEDDHIDHLNEHYEKFQATAQAIQQGRIDIVAGFKYLANLMSHAEMHLNLLQQDPTLQKAYEELFNVHTEFIKILGGIKSAAEVELKKRQEQEQNAIPPEKLAELKLLEFEKVAKQRRTEDLTKHKQALTAQGQQFKQSMALQQQQFEQRLEAQKAENEKRLNVLKEAAKIF